MDMGSVPAPPAGLEALLTACRNVYPDQTNPLQVTAMVKYWLGGPDPLDYVSMYKNLGNDKLGIPPHWHYISFGLSDLHGDGRVHEVSGPDTPSGYGFELTFRLKREVGEVVPPTWPAALMQALAKYVFHSDNLLCAGDHVSWHCALDCNTESRIQHMLMTADPELDCVTTPFGLVKFIQIVGVCAEELQAAQHWNGPGILELLRSTPGGGGPFFVTDMRRGESIFELDPQVQEAVDNGIEMEGSNLSGVSARCSWSEILEPSPDNRFSGGDIQLPQISKEASEQIKLALKKGLTSSKESMKSSLDENEMTHSKEEFLGAEMERRIDEFMSTTTLDGVHLTINLEAGLLLPLAIRGRLKHGRHFTFSSVYGDCAITFVTPAVAGALATKQQPTAVHGPWLQILLNEDILDSMLSDISILESPEEFPLPRSFSWPQRKLAITIVP